MHRKAKGMSQAKYESTTKECDIQYNPAAKNPKPKHQPSQKARRQVCAPSISQIKQGKEIRSKGTAWMGGKAKAAKPPATQAKIMRDQPFNPPIICAL